MSQGIVMKYKPSNYGGIDVVELNYSRGAVWVNGDLEDSYESVEEYLRDHSGLYDSLLECAMAMR